MGPAVAITFLQRALTALNRNGRDYPDLVPDGRVGPSTLAALDTFLATRGRTSGETVLLRALEALRASVTLDWLNVDRPMRRSFMGGLRTVLVKFADSRARVEAQLWQLSNWS
jgi:hypothetical protein